jgi:Plasmid pRiA4b ORF-3-like protein
LKHGESRNKRSNQQCSTRQRKTEPPPSWIAAPANKCPGQKNEGADGEPEGRGSRTQVEKRFEWHRRTDQASRIDIVLTRIAVEWQAALPIDGALVTVRPTSGIVACLNGGFKLRGPFSSRLGVSLKPNIRHQLGQSVTWSGWEPAQHVSEILVWVDPVPLATGGRAEKHSRRTATIVGADKKPFFAAHGLSPQRSLGEVVVDAQVAIFCVATQRLPVGHPVHPSGSRQRRSRRTLVFKMNEPIRITPGAKVSLELTEDERTRILEDLGYLDPKVEATLRKTPAGRPIKMTLDELDELAGCVAAEANHTKNRKLGKILDGIFVKVERLLATHTDERPPKTLRFEDAKKSKVIADQAIGIAEWAANLLIAVRRFRIKSKPVEHLCLSPAQKAVISMMSTLPTNLMTRMGKEGSVFTVSEVASMLMALAEELPTGDSQKQVAVLLVASHLMDSLEEFVLGVAKPTKSKAKAKRKSTKALYQFKITLLETKPAIWRRVQSCDCTLDDLHYLIQAAMGWTNSHLHQFDIKCERYGDPELLDEGREDIEFADSTATRLSDIVPSDGKKFQFLYEYDFGDDWQHEILFEGSPTPDKAMKYPLCLEGERACPPEDVGGVGGYEDFLEAIANPRHEDYGDLLKWVGGRFDPEAFDVAAVNRRLAKLR